MAFESKYEVRKALYELAQLLKSYDCVTLLTSEVPEDGTTTKFSRHGIE